VRSDLTLPAILSKLMALGLPLPEAIRAVTTRPARVLGVEGQLGTLVEGGVADVAIFRPRPGDFEFQGMPEAILEAEGRQHRTEERVTGRLRLEPVYMLAGGRLAAVETTPAASPVSG
jgi:dihydroorotase